MMKNIPAFSLWKKKKSNEGGIFFSVIGLLAIFALLLNTILADYRKNSLYFLETEWFYKLKTMENLAIQQYKSQNPTEQSGKYYFDEGRVEYKVAQNTIVFITKSRDFLRQRKHIEDKKEVADLVNH